MQKERCELPLSISVETSGFGPPGRVLQAPEDRRCALFSGFGPFLGTCLGPVGEPMLEPQNFNPVSHVTRTTQDSDEKLGVSVK